jgi:diguanylate cyclase (GGDEF)-like protein
VGNRICDRVRAIRIADPISGGAYEDLHLSVSIGVANFPEAGRQLNELLMAADNAVFAAKDAGRDRVEHIKPV